jgi:hypothetical protein
MAGRRKKRSRLTAGFFNLLTALLFISALLIVVGGVLVFMAPERLPDRVEQLVARIERVLPTPHPPSLPTPTLVGVANVPTATHTPQGANILPTWTPPPAFPTATPRPSNTPRPTEPPSPAPTIPTNTATPTVTNTPTNTPTPRPPGPTSTPLPTRALFPFTKSDISPFYLQNRANSAGCQWTGIAGVVLDLNRNPVAAGNFVVHVWGGGIDERQSVGGAPAYGPSGWEQFIFDSPVSRQYNVQLESINGTVISQVYQVQTRATCEENLLQIDFVQNH